MNFSLSWLLCYTLANCLHVNLAVFFSLFLACLSTSESLFNLSYMTLFPCVACSSLHSSLLQSSLCFSPLVLYLFPYRFISLCPTYSLSLFICFLLFWYFTSLNLSLKESNIAHYLSGASFSFSIIM